MLAKSASATLLTSASKTHPLAPLGIMTRTYLPLRSPITQRKSVLASTVLAAAACAFGAALRAVFLFVVTLPNTGVSSCATTDDVAKYAKATKAVINRQRFILKSSLVTNFTLSQRFARVAPADCGHAQPGHCQLLSASVSRHELSCGNRMRRSTAVRPANRP